MHWIYKNLIYLFLLDLVCKNFFAAQDGITLSQTEITSQNVRGQASCASGEGQNRGDLLSESALNKENEVVFLYRIVPGNGDTKSHGLWCASIAGLPSHTIGRGNVHVIILFLSST